MKLNTIYNEECLEGLKKIPDKSINLIVIDPPYNIKKAKWDSWKTVEEYVGWMGQVFLECERVLKDNGSFYFFHNDFLQIVELQNWINKNTEFQFKQFLVWNKRFEGVSNKGFLDGFIEPEGLRNYQKMVEYLLFYTFQDETGLKKIYDSKDCFVSIKEYLRTERKRIAEDKNINLTRTDELLAKITNTSTVVRHYWSDAQWSLPTKEMYEMMQTTGYFQRPYEELREEYEELREEYEELRYTYNNQKTHHSVWNYEVAKKQGHITPKPVELIENIIKHSSNENDIVLDCFMGSGTTAIACINTNRRFLGFELDETYFNLANERIVNHRKG